MTDWWRCPRKISVVVDTPGWFDAHAERLVCKLVENGDRAEFVRDATSVQNGDLAFYLSCMRLTPREILDRNRLNLIVHASDLPRGRGFSPVVWQVLEGRNRIPVTMIVADEGADTGPVAMTDVIDLQGHELNDEIRNKLGCCIVKMCISVVSDDSPPETRPQVGEPSWYKKRIPANSRIDPERSIVDLFSLLRVVDNDRYPAFFDLHGHRYRLLIHDLGPIEQGQESSGNAED